MSYHDLAADQITVAAFDEAVAAFKAALGGDDMALIRASTEVGRTMLLCRIRAAAIRGERRTGEPSEEVAR